MKTQANNILDLNTTTTANGPYILSTTSYTDKKTGERRCKHEAEPLDEAGIASTSQQRFHQLNDLDCVSYFVEGAEYGILDNYNPEQGIANGTTGIGVSLTWADKYITHVKKSILKKITNLRDKKQVTVKFLQEILHKAGLNYGKRKRNDLIKLVAPLWQGVHKITNDKRYKL